MKNLIIILLLVFVPILMFGQKINYSTQITNPRGMVFRQNGKKLSQSKLTRILTSNSEAFKEYRIATKNQSKTIIIGAVGGGLIGWSCGIALAGPAPGFKGSPAVIWTPAVIGTGLTIVAIHFSTAYKKHAKNAVRLYNERLKPTGFNNADFKIGLTCNGIGIMMRF